MTNSRTSKLVCYHHLFFSQSSVYDKELSGQLSAGLRLSLDRESFGAC